MHKFLARSACLILFLLSLSTPGAAQSSSLVFTDVPPNHPHYYAITHLKEAGIVNGVSETTFDPNGLVNRATGLKMMLLGLELYNPDQDPAGFDIQDPTGLDFSDITEKAWFVPYVRYAKNQNILNGYEDGSFQPARELNLAEVLKILVNAYDHSGLDLISALEEDPFTDVSKDAWFARYFQYARDHNILLGDIRYEVHPAQQVTRAQLAELIYRFRMMSKNHWKIYDLGQHWEKRSFPFVRSALKVPSDWNVSSETDYLALWKPDSENEQQIHLRVYPFSARITFHLEQSSDTAKNYFSKIKESYSDVQFGEQKNMLEVTGPTLYHRYQFIGDNTYLVILTDTGGKRVSRQDLEIARTALLSHEVIAGPKNDDVPNAESLLSELRQLIHVDGKGRSIINKITDLELINTDTIGVGTGPVDYFYSQSLNYTIKYERSFDVILDIRENRTSQF